MSMARPLVTSSHGHGEDVTARWLNLTRESLVRFSLVNWLSWMRRKCIEFDLTSEFSQLQSDFVFWTFKMFRAVKISIVQRIFTRLALAFLRIFSSLKILHFAPRTFRRWGETFSIDSKGGISLFAGIVLNANCSRMPVYFGREINKPNRSVSNDVLRKSFERHAAHLSL